MGARHVWPPQGFPHPLLDLLRPRDLCSEQERIFCGPSWNYVRSKRSPAITTVDGACPCRARQRQARR